MEATNNHVEPHQHHCAIGVHPAGREVPYDPKESPWAREDPTACGCPNPEKPQCCANHPMANPNYQPRREISTSLLQGYAQEIRELKADVLELKEQVAVLTGQVGKVLPLRTV